MVQQVEALGEMRKRPDLWTPQTRERLSVRDRVNEEALDIIFDVTPRLYNWVDEGYGRSDTGYDVKGREADDVEIRIDKDAESIIVDSLTASSQRNRLAIRMLSEHGNYDIGNNPQFYFSLDPFDNSDEYKKRFDTPNHISGSFYDFKTGEYAAAIDINLFTLHAFVLRDEKIYDYNLKKGRVTEILAPAEIKTIEDPAFNIASYDGRDKYMRKFNEYLDEINLRRLPKTTFHGKAGAHLYPYMAQGSVSAYAMFDEPYGEIFPGLPFAIAAGFHALDVKDDGSYEEVKFDPSLQHESIPFYVVARTIQLGEQIIEIAMRAKREKNLPDWGLKAA